MLISGFLEAVSVISIAPFLALAVSPDWTEKKPLLNFLYIFFNFNNHKDFLAAVGAFFIFINFSSNAIKVLLKSALIRFSCETISNVSSNMHKVLLNQPYTFFLTHNSANLLRRVFTEVNFVVNNFLTPLLSCIESCITVSLLLLVIIKQNPTVAFISGSTFGCIYIAIYFGLRLRIKHYGTEAKNADKIRFMILKEGFESIKFAKLLNLESYFATSYGIHASRSSRMQGNNHITNIVPRYCVDSIAMIGIVGITLYFVRSKEQTSEVLPILAIYGFAFYRLIPNIQNIYSNATKMQFATPRVETLIKETTSLKVIEDKLPLNSTTEFKQIHNSPQLEVRNLEFKYPTSSKKILQNINFKIHENQCIGFLGKTGSGKTTLLDLMLGLLPPDKGEILHNGRSLKGINKKLWQRNIGYVPQDIILLDTSVKRNIAFGVEEKKIDMEKVKRAAIMANIDNFIESNLSSAYDTEVGDRGIRLSGGQRQRIGIARALYREPKILFFDEATSSLDNQTEKELMQAIERLHGKLTIVIVAHRLNTLQGCDWLINLSNGRVSKSGTFKHVLKQFR